MPVTSEQFDGSDLQIFLSKLGIGYDVLLFMDSIEEVMHLSAESQMDPDFAARIDLIQVTGPPQTIAAATPTAGSCGLHVSWAAFQLLEMLGLLVPSRCGPALFLGNIDGTGGEDAAMKQAGCYKRMSVMFTSCVMYIYICFLFIHCIIVNQSKTFAAEFNYS
ncbi:unnamed protein product [Durusdinium trenchii]